MSKKIEPESQIGKLELGQLIELVHRHTGISMTEKKTTMLQGRLRSRLRELNMEKYDEYIRYLADQPKEIQEFVNRVTTNETYFFRTPRVWEYLSNVFLPARASQITARSLNVWSAASSSGEEAYSIAMACQDQKAKTPNLQYQIHGSDISTDVLSIATAARYEGRSHDDLKTKHAVRYKKYMLPDEKGATVVPELRSRVSFFTHNLYGAPKHPKFYDIVFLRNVLIYFTVEDQLKVLEKIGQALVPGGILILGESDSLARLKTDFEFVEPLIYRKA